MVNVKLNVSRSQVDRAGGLLLSDGTATNERDKALEVLANWRAAHAFPLNTIYMDMKRKAERVNSDALAVQRLKRQRSILSKLAKRSTMRLSQMQDIGGCRTVLPKLNHVHQVIDVYKKSQAEHEFVTSSNYIEAPQESGYRSVHLIYKYKSKTRPEYNGLLFEVQIRTELQHAWATAVETVGAVIGQSLKSSEGEQSWLDFFRHASGAFAMIEGSSPVPNLSDSSRDIALNLQLQLRQLDVQANLRKYGAALRATEDLKVKDASYFLLVLRPDTPTLEIYAYRKGQIAQADRDYARFEAELPGTTSPQLSLFPELNDYSGAQAVLVGAQSFRSLRQSYPNYYLDTNKFIDALKRFIASNVRTKAGSRV